MPIPADSSHKPQSALPKPPLFPTGQIVATPGALELLQRHGLTPWPFIARHVEGDWGDLDAEDAALNRAAVTDGSRILSAYVVEGDRLWVITDAAHDDEGNRQSTCLLLPEEY